MPTPQRLPVSLTTLETALAALLDGLQPIAPTDLPLAEALGCIAAEMPALSACPKQDVATADGWAFCARDLVGASSYSPLALAVSPVWVEAGDPMPAGCDCVMDSDLVDQTGPVSQIFGEALPGQGVRRAGGDLAGGGPPVAAGRRISALDLLLARAAGLVRLSLRRPRLRIVNVGSVSGNDMTTQLIAESASAAGASVVVVEAGRDAPAIGNALDAAPCDLFVTIGGTGVGRTDATASALDLRGTFLFHGIALQPGRTTAIGRIGGTPVIALPGAPDQALAAWWTLALPVLERLTNSKERQTLTLPLRRKIASSVGVAEIVLLEEIDQCWMPLAAGDLTLDRIGRADAWLAIPGGSEGFAAGAPVDAYMLRDRS
jgi:molybdopterin molybdotransferase